MKEKITLYKQVDRFNVVHVHTVKIDSYRLLASLEVEVEFPKFDKKETQRAAIRSAIDEAKSEHEKKLNALELELEGC